MDASFEVVEIRTTGDRDRALAYASIGPKGVFAAELQAALAGGEVDLAVHSAKDLPASEPEGLRIVAVPERDDPRDVLVSRSGEMLDELPPGARVGTSSSRRRAQVAILRPDLEVVGLRGNVETRLGKVASGEVDAAILAGAGLVRLGLTDEVTEWLDPERFVPPPGQGAIAIEAAVSREDLGWAAGAEHPPSRVAFDAERAFMESLEGGCEIPLGAWARPADGGVALDGFVAAADGSRHLRGSLTGDDPSDVGLELARRLAADGAAELIAEIRGA